MLPAKIFGDKKLVVTDDGSFTFYNINYNESYRAKSVGAYTESLHKYVLASDIIDLLKKQDVMLLDICLGIGMNLVATIEQMKKNNIKNKLHIVSVELDVHLLKVISDVKILSPLEPYNILRTLLASGKVENITLDLHIADVSKFIDNLGYGFDVIYFDPFSKNHNPEVWQSYIYKKLYSILKPEGRLVTYGKSVEIKEGFIEAGFTLSSIKSLGKRKNPSLKAVKHSDI